MPNFDFLNNDDSAQSGSPGPVEVRQPRYPIWTWSITFSESSHMYFLACLGNDALFVGCGYKTPAERSTAIAQLCTQEPEAVFRRDFDRYPLDSIQRIRFRLYYAWLDIIRADGSMETICDFETRQTESLFVALHERLAPVTPIEIENVQMRQNLAIPLALFTTIALVAGFFLTASLASDEGRDAMGRTNMGVMLVESLGATTTTMLCIAAILAGLAFVAYKLLNPPKALAVDVKNRQSIGYRG